MDIATSYVIKSLVTSGILYMYYLVVLRNKRFHSYNRFYLLIAVVSGLIIPFIHFNWYQIEPMENISITKFLSVINNFPVKKNTPVYFTTESVIYICICSISLFLLLKLFLKVTWIYNVKKAGTITKMQGFNLIETPVKQAPFSFLNNLFWKRGMPMMDTIGEKIFKHELTHIRQHHSYDKLFTQIVACICWINPFYWIILKELDTIHEFIADAAAIEEDDTESLALMLLQAHNEGRYLSPSHSFFNSSIKRRLIMITSSKKRLSPIQDG